MLAVGATAVTSAAELRITLPAERTELKPGPHADVAAANCVTCHSWDYVSIQPPLSRPAWKATVTKMRATFGAPIAENQIDDLVDYLAKTYGEEQPGLQKKTDTPSTAPKANGDALPKHP